MAEIKKEQIDSKYDLNGPFLRSEVFSDLIQKAPTLGALILWVDHGINALQASV